VRSVSRGLAAASDASAPTRALATEGVEQARAAGLRRNRSGGGRWRPTVANAIVREADEQWIARSVGESSRRRPHEAARRRVLHPSRRVLEDLR
jgi:hypothetical protein